MYEPITVEIDRGYGGGAYRSLTINFSGRLVYLVHVEEDGPGKRLRRTLYPFINTHSARATPRKGYTAEEVSRAYPEFDKGRFLFLGYPRSSPTR